MANIKLNVKGVQAELEQEKALEKFINDFKKLIDEYRRFSGDEKEMVKSYSKLARSERDPDKDLDIIESDLYDLGWDESSLSSLFSKYRLEIQDELIDGSFGTFDYFLYKWTGSKFPLAGYTLDTSLSDDITIKFSYGWHQLPYGKLWLEQNNALDNFSELAAKALSDEILLLQNFGSGILPSSITREWKIENKLKTYLKVEGSSLIFEIEKLLNAVNLIIFLNKDDVKEDHFTLESMEEKIRLIFDSCIPGLYTKEKTGDILKITLK
jgi:hypothetical protein